VGFSIGVVNIDQFHRVDTVSGISIPDKILPINQNRSIFETMIKVIHYGISSIHTSG